MKGRRPLSLNEVTPLETRSGEEVITETINAWTDPLFLLQALGLIVLFLEGFTELNLVSYFVTDPVMVETINRWASGLFVLGGLLLRLFQAKQPVTLR